MSVPLFQGSKAKRTIGAARGGAVRRAPCIRFGVNCGLTGADPAAFVSLAGRADLFAVTPGRIARA